jgi:putative MFS transporter
MQRSPLWLVARISAGGWFEAFDLFMTSYIALGLYREGLFSPTGQGLGAFATFIGAGFAGMFFGTLLFGWISDHFGRRATFTWSLVFYSAMTLGMATAPTAGAIDVWRFLAGVGIGVQIITIDAYVSEIAPAAQRGSYIAFSQFLSFTAVPCVAFLSARLVPIDIAGLAGWRWVAIIGSVGAAAAFGLQRGLPESPRWLGGRRDGGIAGAWREIWNPAYRSRTILLVAFNVLQIFGYYGFTSWVTTLLYQEHIEFVRSLEYTAAIAIANPFGPLVALCTADRVERKWQLAVLAVAISGLGIAFGQARMPSSIITFGIALALALNWFSSAFHAYQAELYPTRIRARAVGFVYSWSRFSSIGVGFAIAAVLKEFGPSGVFAMIAAAMMTAGALVAAFGPRTNRLELDTVAP